MLNYKVDILRLMTSGEAETLSDAARKLGLEPARIHNWTREDKDFQELVHMTHEVVADDLEKQFRHHPNFIPQMMLLKGYRPMFRDNYKVIQTNENLEKLLAKLTELAVKSEKIEEKQEED